jgi:hypothetical protein
VDSRKQWFDAASLLFQAGAAREVKLNNQGREMHGLSLAPGAATGKKTPNPERDRRRRFCDQAVGNPSQA